MRIVPAGILLAFASTSAAVAAPRATDVDYLKASRCKGLASALGGTVDTAQLDAFLKRERSARMEVIVQKGAAEQVRAQREARRTERQARLTAELHGGCTAYLSGGAQAAGQSAPST